jgi:hypothetical protein
VGAEDAPAKGVFRPFLVLPQQPHDEKLHDRASMAVAAPVNAGRPM